MDVTIVAYATLALSLLVSAIKLGGVIVNADPRSIVNAGRWALAACPILALAVLAWLVTSGRWTPAMLLAAFLLPVLMQAAPRWRVLFAPLHPARRGFQSFAAEMDGGAASGDARMRELPDPEVVAQAIAVLRVYVEGSRPAIAAPPAPQVEHRPAAIPRPPLNGGNGHLRMSTREAFAVLGLDPTTSPREVKEAHRRLVALVDPEFGGTAYLLTKIDEARDVLLGE
jgi:hypothetical protein